MSAVPLPDAMLQHHVLVQRLSASEVRKFTPFLVQMDAEIRKRLSGDELTTFQRAQLEQLLGNLDGALQSIQTKFHNQLSVDLALFAAHEAAFSATAVESVIEGVSFAIPSSTQLHAALTSRPLSFRGPDGGKVLDTFIKDWSKKERDTITGVIRRGVIEGKTNSEMVREIRGTRAAKHQDGVLATTERHAKAVVQTAVSQASTVARQETYETNADIVKGVQWLSTLDSHVCLQCGAMDHKVFAITEGPRPPLHPGDRCTTTPVLDDKYQKLMEGVTRPAVVDGKVQHVPATESYYEWLMRQPQAFQEQAIGVVRAKLLRDGGLSAKRFAELQLDRNFRPLTLDELRQIEPLAFKRAGL